MATQLEALIGQARSHLIEETASFWEDDELVAIANRGFKDLWGAIIDLHDEHFFTVDAENVSMPAGSSTLLGVPADVFRVLLIEPRDVSDSGSTRAVTFTPKDYQHRDFRSVRRRSAQDPSGPLQVLYAISQAGAPVGAPTIHVGPLVTSEILLTLTYIPTVDNKMIGDQNPVPGESDNAIVSWIVAWARAKERDDRSPDPAWLAIYGTEKKNILTRLAPRQEQEPRCVEGVFDDIAYEDNDWV